jgi:hypothetical protein
MAEGTAADRAKGIERCSVCAKDWRMPLNHRACVESLDRTMLAWMAKAEALETRNAALTEVLDECRRLAGQNNGLRLERERDAALAQVALLEADLTTARADGYAAGAQAHVEHHRCERCYGAGIVVGQALLP